jgi:hypothetical protein
MVLDLGALAARSSRLLERRMALLGVRLGGWGMGGYDSAMKAG